MGLLCYVRPSFEICDVGPPMTDPNWLPIPPNSESDVLHRVLMNIYSKQALFPMSICGKKLGTNRRSMARALIRSKEEFKGYIIIVSSLS